MWAGLLTFVAIAALWFVLLDCGPDDSAEQDQKWRDVGPWVR